MERGEGGGLDGGGEGALEAEKLLSERVLKRRQQCGGVRAPSGEAVPCRAEVAPAWRGRVRAPHARERRDKLTQPGGDAAPTADERGVGDVSEGRGPFVDMISAAAFLATIWTLGRVLRQARLPPSIGALVGTAAAFIPAMAASTAAINAYGGGFGAGRAALVRLGGGGGGSRGSSNAASR